MRVLPAVFGMSLLMCSHLLCAADSKAICDVPQLHKACSDKGMPFVLLNVWAVNCSHCVDELSLLSKLADERFKDSKEIAFFSLCLGDASIAGFDERYAAILTRKKISYETALWKGPLDVLQRDIQLEATPYTALVNRDGKVLEVLEMPRDVAQAEAVIRGALKRAAAGATR